MTILYDDVDIDYKATKEAILENYPEEEWSDIDHITDERLYQEIDCMNSNEWEYLSCELEQLFKKDDYIIFGTCGRWDGDCECGTFIRSLDDFQRFTRHLDGIKIVDDNGHCYIEGYHHDGSDKYELRRLTDRGRFVAERHHFAHDRHLHEVIMKTNFYSCLPKFGKLIYGV